MASAVNQQSVPFRASSMPLLATCEYPCSGRPIQPEPVVLIHGWGSDSRIWQMLLPQLSRHFHVITIDLPGFGQSTGLSAQETKSNTVLEDCLDALLAVLPPCCTLMGWSLGGMLATQLAGRYPERFKSLITLASNPCFVQKADWPSAMSQQTFKDFCQLFQQQPVVCLKRFYGLQCRGDSDERNLLKALKASAGDSFEKSLSENTQASWLQGLLLLADIDNRQTIKSLEIPGLHIYGEADQLVPVPSAHVVASLNPLQQVSILAQRAHLPHLSCPDELVQRILDFQQQHSTVRVDHGNNSEQSNGYHLDKKRVADSFSRAARSYDSVARLQRQVGQRLMGFLPDHLNGNSVVDLGCGTGYFTEHLAKKYPAADFIGLDLAQGMLTFAGAERRVNVRWLCADAEALPLADQSVDLIFSNLAIQWCERLPQLAADIARVLKPGGHFAFTSLGTDTLHQLRASWAEVDDYVHVNRFTDAEHWQTAFELAGMGFHHVDIEHCDLAYRDLRHLTDELKGLGAHNVNAGQNRGLTSPKQVRMLIQAYEQYRQADGQLPATWEVIYGVATRHG